MKNIFLKNFWFPWAETYGMSQCMNPTCIMQDRVVWVACLLRGCPPKLSFVYITSTAWHLSVTFKPCLAFSSPPFYFGTPRAFDQRSFTLIMWFVKIWKKIFRCFCQLGCLTIAELEFLPWCMIINVVNCDSYFT